MLVICADRNIYLRPTCYLAGTNCLGVNQLEEAARRPALDWVLAVASNGYGRAILQSKQEGVEIQFMRRDLPEGGRIIASELEDAALWLCEQGLGWTATIVCGQTVKYNCLEAAVLEEISDYVKILEA